MLGLSLHFTCTPDPLATAGGRPWQGPRSNTQCPAGACAGDAEPGGSHCLRGVSLGRNGLQAGQLAVPMAESTFGTHPAPRLSIPVGQRAARTSSGRRRRRVVMGSGPGDVRVERLGPVPMLHLYWGPGGSPSCPRPGRGCLRPWSQRWAG